MTASPQTPHEKLTLYLSPQAAEILTDAAERHDRALGWLVGRLWMAYPAARRHNIWHAQAAPARLTVKVGLYLPRSVYDDIHASSAHYDRSMGWLASRLLTWLSEGERTDAWVTPAPPLASVEAHP